MGSERPTLLVTGATGQVGHALVRAFGPLGTVVAPGRAELDLEDGVALRRYVLALRPVAVLNAAAYTAVDRAESDVDRCRRINTDAPAVLARVAAEVDAVMVHYSTDYVFDGASQCAYVESDAAHPLNVYGASKRDGELGVLAAGGTHLVLRTSWVYGARGSNFLIKMLRLAREREEIRVVDDQVGAPTWSRDIARATAEIVGPGLLADAERDALREASGLYHLTAGGATSWYGFASAIVAAVPVVEGQALARVVPISSAEYPTAARRPGRSVLDCARVRARFGVRMPEWRDGVERVVGEATGRTP